MPKLKKSTAKRRARKLVKDCEKLDFNESALARKEGVSQQAIHQRMQRTYVQETMTEIMEKQGLTDKALVVVLKSGLGAKKGKKIDYFIRHKYLGTALDLKGHIKKGDVNIVTDNRKFQHFEFGTKTGDEISDFLTKRLKNR